MIKNDLEPLVVGDFVKNTIHGYIALILAILNPDTLHDVRFADLVILDSLEVKAEADIRIEVLSELEKVSPTLPLIVNAKKYLKLKSSQNLVDNLLYVELLAGLREKEKTLQNEN